MDMQAEKSAVSKQEVATAEPLKGAELDKALQSLKSQNGLDPTTTNRLLAIETAETPGVSKLNRAIPAVLVAGYIATFAATRLAGGDLPAIDMPQALHEVLQAVHNLSTNSAREPTLSEHLPFLLLEGAAVWGAVKTLPNWFRARGKKQQVKEAQRTITETISKGEFQYNMAPGHTAAFIGLGDPLADRLQQIKNADEVMLYSQARIDNQVWQLLTKNGQQEQIFRGLDQGDFKNAGEVLLLPVKSEDMFLPDKTGHDMTIDEIAAMINVVDEYCQSRGLPKKKVIIVGSKGMEESYVRRNSEGQSEESKQTLAELVDDLNKQRESASIEIIDPTEIIMRRIITLANGKTVSFVSTKESDQRYGQRFYEQLEAMNYQPTVPGSVNVLYNITDIPTGVRTGKDDIAVILDPSNKRGLQTKGLLEENIIVVPDVALQALSGEVDKS